LSLTLEKGFKKNLESQVSREFKNWVVRRRQIQKQESQASETKKAKIGEAIASLDNDSEFVWTGHINQNLINQNLNQNHPTFHADIFTQVKEALMKNGSYNRMFPMDDHVSSWFLSEFVPEFKRNQKRLVKDFQQRIDGVEDTSKPSGGQIGSEIQLLNINKTLEGSQNSSGKSEIPNKDLTTRRGLRKIDFQNLSLSGLQRDHSTNFHNDLERRGYRILSIRELSGYPLRLEPGLSGPVVSWLAESLHESCNFAQVVSVDGNDGNSGGSSGAQSGAQQPQQTGPPDMSASARSAITARGDAHVFCAGVKKERNVKDAVTENVELALGRVIRTLTTSTSSGRSLTSGDLTNVSSSGPNKNAALVRAVQVHPLDQIQEALVEGADEHFDRVCHRNPMLFQVADGLSNLVGVFGKSTLDLQVQEGLKQTYLDSFLGSGGGRGGGGGGDSTDAETQRIADSLSNATEDTVLTIAAPAVKLLLTEPEDANNTKNHSSDKKNQKKDSDYSAGSIRSRTEKLVKEIAKLREALLLLERILEEGSLKFRMSYLISAEQRINYNGFRLEVSVERAHATSSVHRVYL
jgi:hypothetical protein